MLCMKRANLVLDENFLEQALVFSKQKTYSDAVNEALKEYCRIHKARKILSFQGSGIWDDSESEIRPERRGLLVARSNAPKKKK